MVNQIDDWIDEDANAEVVPKGKPKPRPNLAEDLDFEETSEWRRERGARGRKPAGKKRRRPRPSLEGEY